MEMDEQLHGQMEMRVSHETVNFTTFARLIHSVMASLMVAN